MAAVKKPARYTGPERTAAEALEALEAQGAATILITFADGSVQTLVAAPRSFDKSGSVGFYAQGPASDSAGRRMQVGVTITAVGSKNLPR